MYSSAQKYDDSYKNIAKRLKNFESPVHQNQALADFFKYGSVLRRKKWLCPFKKF
jgi:hypothetical protein